MVPVKHKQCGGQTGWYLEDTGKPGDPYLSVKYMRMDGTKPGYGELFKETCFSCGERIAALSDLKRDFGKD